MHGKYNLISVRYDKISEIFPCVQQQSAGLSNAVCFNANILFAYIYICDIYTYTSACCPNMESGGAEYSQCTVYGNVQPLYGDVQSLHYSLKNLSLK